MGSKIKDVLTDAAKKTWSVLKRIWIWLVIGVTVIAVILGVSLYTSHIRSKLKSNSLDNMCEVTEQSTAAFTNYIEKDLNASKRLADRLATLNVDSNAEINRMLEVINAQTTTYTVTIIKAAAGKESTEKTVYSNVGATAGKVDETSFTELVGLFTDAGVGLESALAPGDGRVAAIRGVLTPREHVSFTEADKNVNYMVYYQAFQFAQGSVAVLQEYRNVNEIAEKFSPSFYDGEGRSFIIDDGGRYITGDRGDSNFFEGISGSAADELRADIAEGRSGIREVSLDGYDQTVAYYSVGYTDGWYMIAAVGSSVVNKFTESIVSTSTIFGVTIAFMVVAVVLMVFVVRSNKRTVTNKEAEIVNREQLFDILANNTNDVFLMIAKSGLTVEYVSPNVERVLGVTVREIKKDIKNIGKAKYVRGDKVNYATLEELVVGSSVSFETERLHKYTNERRYFNEAVYRVNCEQSEKYIVAISDRTEELFAKQSLEEALSIAKVANKAKSAFLANMSHDIRTPMNAIVGLCTLLDKDADDPVKAREHIRQITLSSRHMLEILNDILDMSTIESGKTALNISEVKLSDIIMEVDNIIRPQARVKNQAFNIVTAVQEESFLGDKLRIKQILLNILTNAVKYTPENGRIDFSIRQMARATKKYVRLQFIVKDSGVGMEPAFLKTIFEPFTRDTASVANGTAGTGLGMPIAKNLVDLMGGTIAVESKPGEGSTFTVNIKFQLKENEGATDFWSEHGIERMLVIGCSGEDRESISDAMGKTDVVVHFADSAKNAITVAVKAQKDGKSFDVVLCDWQSTEHDRIMLIAALKQALPVKAPIIAFGEHDWSESERHAMEQGVKKFLVKPFFYSGFKECFDAAKTPTVPDEAAVEGVLDGMRFLAAEDNELNSMILVELLKNKGAECVVMRNGEEVVKEFEKSEAGRYDAVLMDVQMPVMNGYEATRAIRACDHPNAKAIPIIAMTANAFAGDVQNSLNSGMDAHLTKPVDMVELEKVIFAIKDSKK